jgi:hypothetical protein
MSELDEAFVSLVTIEATAEADHPDRPLTAQERAHLGLADEESSDDGR